MKRFGTEEYRGDADRETINTMLKDVLKYEPLIKEYWINQPFEVVYVEYWDNNYKLVQDTFDYKVYTRYSKFNTLGI